MKMRPTAFLNALFVFLLVPRFTHATQVPIFFHGISTKVSSLDPYMLTGIDGYNTTSYVIEPLVRLNPFTKEFIPCLAESWKVEDSRLVVYLRKGVKFSTGEPLTAEDVKFTIDSYYDDRFAGQMWRGMWAQVAKTEVKDSHTVVFHLKEMSFEPVKIILTALRILPKKAYETSEKSWRVKNIIGTGPYRLKRFDANRSIDFEPNPHWWGASPPEHHIKVKSVGDYKLAEMMIKKGELDFFEVSASVALNAKSEFLVAVPSAAGSGVLVVLNHKNELFKEAGIRRALILLWDRETLNRKIFEGQWKVAVDGFSPRMSFYPKGEPLPFDPKKAAEELKRLGWADSNKDNVLDKNGKDFAFELQVDSAETERWATLYQNDAAKIGVKVTLKRLEEDSQRWKMITEGKFDAVASEGKVSDEVYSVSWHSKAEYGFFGYANKDVDKALDQLKTKFQSKERAPLQAKLIKIIRADHAQLPGLYSEQAYFLKSKRLTIDQTYPAQGWLWKLAVSN